MPRSLRQLVVRGFGCRRLVAAVACGLARRLSLGRAVAASGEACVRSGRAAAVGCC